MSIENQEYYLLQVDFSNLDQNIFEFFMGILLEILYVSSNQKRL